jgi:hypothetical protein
MPPPQEEGKGRGPAEKGRGREGLREGERVIWEFAPEDILGYERI